ncbi:histidinol-phosphate transaminase [Ketobacter alkanivorans]|uniref:Histidinol-phosphate aminotransferase n=1 Tax=Ketobacter alkanivorans TaxID=1917421 RepID=A0A2K9LHD9_9GAMM|nr:histidinol-phosphate transaminase [Ketobacter alkanivorans]AUM11571.1 histidinol-phosphate transaminase [Ketobacter alkanivorans]
MTCDYIALATTGVQGLTPYVPGKPIDELERELGISNIIKLASNENPLGPSPKVLQALDQVKADLTRYPDGNGFRLKQALAAKLGVKADTITLGNGSNDVLDLIARAYLSAGDEAIFSQYAFAVYPISTQACGATAVVTPAKDWGHDLAAMASAITDKTKLIFIANPNNPTGTSFGRQEWERFISKVPEHVLVVLDEAYIEYVENDAVLNGVDYLNQYPNLIVTRTFSKAYGLAALRVGYGLSHPQVANVLNRVRQPFNVDSFALAAATAVLDDESYLQRSRDLNRQGLQQFEEGFRSLGLEYIPSAGNFITVHFEQQGTAVYQKLLLEGVITRPVANYGMANSLRISVGLPEENRRCLDALAKVLAQC